MATDGSNYLQCGFDEMQEILQRGINELLQQANISIKDILGASIGLAGFGEIRKDEIKLKARVKKVMKSIPYIIVNDVVIGWAGSLGLNSGINIISGTGSIVYGVDDKKNTMRCGGWGHEIGDEGSAYWIGKEAIRYFTLQSDGRIKKTFLYEKIRTYFKLSNDFDIIDIFHRLNRKEVAILSKHMSDLASQGDVCAKELFRKAALELSCMVESVVNCLFFSKNPIVVSGAGGVLQSGNILFSVLKRELKKVNCIYQPPLLKPVEGASLMAAIKFGKMDINEITKWVSLKK